MMTHSDAAAVCSATDAVASSSPSASPSSPPSDVVPPASSRALDHDDDSEAEAADVCPICLDADLEDGTMLTTSCGHRFCEACILAALAHKKECPSCRQGISNHRKLRADSQLAAALMSSIQYDKGGAVFLRVIMRRQIACWS